MVNAISTLSIRLQAFREAEAYDGPSLVIAYSQCIAHGIDMRLGMDQQYRAVASGHWPLLRFDPRRADGGKNPLRLDSKPPSRPYREFVESEARFNMLWHTDPERAERLLGEAQDDVRERHFRYQQLAAMDWTEPTAPDDRPAGKERR